MIPKMFSAVSEVPAQFVGTSNAVVITTIILGALAPTLFALAGYLKAAAAKISADKARDNTEQSKNEIVVLKERIDGQMTALIKTTEKAAFAAGAAEQTATIATMDAAKAQGAADQVAATIPASGNKVDALANQVAELQKSINELKQTR